jgi:hypothetical protein
MEDLFTPEAVFVTDGYPVHTYVPQEDGKKELSLKDGLGQRNKIISISGPSKSGKTTLCDKVFGNRRAKDRIYVTGDTIQKPDDLWYEAYRQVLDESDEGFYDLSQSQRIGALIDTKLPLVIDDYHYIPSDIQKQIARQIKSAASQGLRIICLSVPHRGDDPIRNNGDLSGRYFSVTFDYWSSDDLLKIPIKGFGLVGHPVDKTFNEAIATEALRSPQVMQTLCLEACRIHGPDKPLEHVTPSVDRMPEIIDRTLRSYNHSSGDSSLIVTSRNCDSGP